MPRDVLSELFHTASRPPAGIQKPVSDVISAVEKGVIVHNIIKNINGSGNPENILKTMDEEVKPYIKNYLASPLFKSCKKY